MKTSKPLSAISYNTDEFLKQVCESLLRCGVLANYAYICHHGEGGDKAHIHLLLFPSKALDTCRLGGNFLEAVDGEVKPRQLVGLRVCRSVVDWVMYSIHDPAYLAIKGERRECHYMISDFVVGSDDEWRCVLDEVRFAALPCPSYSVSRNIIYDALESDPHVTWSQLVTQVPFAPRDFFALHEYFDAVKLQQDRERRRKVLAASRAAGTAIYQHKPALALVGSPIE